jgi:hypothetical protein
MPDFAETIVPAMAQGTQPGELRFHRPTHSPALLLPLAGGTPQPFFAGTLLESRMRRATNIS